MLIEILYFQEACKSFFHFIHFLSLLPSLPYPYSQGCLPKVQARPEKPCYTRKTKWQAEDGCMETRQRDCSEAFARQLDHLRPWLRYVLGWTLAAGLTPLVLLIAGQLDTYPLLAPWIYGALIPALWAIWQAGRCPHCRRCLPNSREPAACPHCGCRLR